MIIPELILYSSRKIRKQPRECMSMTLKIGTLYIHESFVFLGQRVAMTSHKIH